MTLVYTILYFTVSFAIIAFLLWVIWLLLYSMIRGGPYAPTGKSKIDIMLDLVQIKPGEKAVDIGAGDGRIVIALAKKGAEAHGIEINPLLVFLARRKIKKEGLEGKAFMHTADMWKQDYSKFAVVTLFMTKHALRGLEKKLQKELRPGARVALNYYTFPTWKPAKQASTVYMYKQTGSKK